MATLNENRRDFIRQAAMAAAAFPFLAGCRPTTLAQRNENDILNLIKRNARAAGAEGMGAIDVPPNVSSNATLASANDEGEPMIISGTMFQTDGKTPAPNTLIYLYHTDMSGIYGPVGEHKHGKFRGWMLTDPHGRYEFRSIRPASYPNTTFAAHIHMTVTGADHREDWIDSILFEGDRFITAREREMAGKKGGFRPILKLEKDPDGIARGVRDIQLLG